MQLQVFVYKLPSLPGSQSRGYSVTDRALAAPANATVRSPNFGSAGIATTLGAEYIFVSSPAGPQGTPQLTALYGTPTVYVYKVRQRSMAAVPVPAAQHFELTHEDISRVLVTSMQDCLL